MLLHEEARLMKTFLSYSFRHVDFVRLVNRYLVQQEPRIQPFFYSSHRNSKFWPSQLKKRLAESDAFVLFLGDALGSTQEKEMGTAFLHSRIRHKLWVRLSSKPDAKAADFCALRDSIWLSTDHVEKPNDAEALRCAQEIMRLLELQWLPPDDVPRGYLFDYEKDIIKAYIAAKQGVIDERIPPQWPTVEKIHHTISVKNPISASAIGEYRKEADAVVVNVHTDRIDPALSFPEAGPREILRYPSPGHPHLLKVGILVSGGIAPGINAVISGIVNRHWLYAKPPVPQRSADTPHAPYKVEVYRYLEGFKALARGSGNHRLLTPEDVRDKAHRGGSILGTSRLPELLEPSLNKRIDTIQEIIQTLAADRIEILYVIGGDGSMRAAHALWTVARQKRPDLNLSVIAIPKTMDNDILWVWQSFGFLSAVEKAKEAILNLQTEVKSNPRLCVIQLFGSDSGFVVAQAVLASGGCDYALIPEVGFTLKTLCNHIKAILTKRYLTKRYTQEQRPYAIIVMSETAIPRDVEKYIDRVDLADKGKDAIRKFTGTGQQSAGYGLKWRVQGQTPDKLRTAGLKIVARVLQDEIRLTPGDEEYWSNFRAFTNEPRHLIRAIPPSVSDVIFGQRLGTLAVDNAMAGYTDFMVSHWLTEYVLVP
jgi:6-phosphofructokinase 1